MKFYLYAGPKALIMTPKMDMFPAPWSFSRALSKCLSHCGTILAARFLAFNKKVNWSQSDFCPKKFAQNIEKSWLISKDEAGCFNLWAQEFLLKFLKNSAAVWSNDKILTGKVKNAKKWSRGPKYHLHIRQLCQRQ